MQSHGYKTALVIGADKLTYFHDPTKFMPLTVFADGAGAVVLEDHQHAEYGLGSFSAGSDGDLSHYVWIPEERSPDAVMQRVPEEGLDFWRFKFDCIHEWAVDRMVRGTREAVAKSGLTLGDIKWIVPHQASVNIIRDLAKRLELPEEKFILTFPHTGNVASGSVPIALDESKRGGQFKHGDWLVMPAAGAGMAWAAATYRWNDSRTTRPRRVVRSESWVEADAVLATSR